MLAAVLRATKPLSALPRKQFALLASALLLVMALLTLAFTLSPPSAMRLRLTSSPSPAWPAQPVATSSFCPAMLANPIRPHWRMCERAPDMTCTDGPTAGQLTFFSQVAQDYYLFMNHFVHLRRRGVYVELGTQKPIKGSNTFFFDTCLQWAGLCFEANPKTHVDIYMRRTCDLVPTCASRTHGERAVFVMDNDAGGVEKTSKNLGTERAERSERQELECTSLRAAMTRRSISAIDYLSLDVEGHELEVLHGFDYDSHVINVMTIETTEESLPPIEKFLKTKGYVRHVPTLNSQSIQTALLRRDAVFLHKDVVWGHPA